MKRRFIGMSIVLLATVTVSFGFIKNQPIQIEGEYEIVGISRNKTISWSEFTKMVLEIMVPISSNSQVKTS